MKKLFCCLLLAITLFNACKKPVPDLALLVPKDAATVFIVDVKALGDKLSASGITIDSLANTFSDPADSFALHWNDIKNAGIDFNKPVLAFTRQSNAMKTGQTTSLGIIASVNDKDKLVAFLKKQKPGADVEPGNKYNYLALGNDFVAGWNDKAVIFSMVKSGTFYTGKYSTGENTLSQQQLSQLFSQDEAASVASVGGFRDMLKKKGDVHFYFNPASNLGAVAAFQMTKLSSLFEDSYSEGVIDFEKGKATAVLESHLSKAMEDILAKYPSKEVQQNMVTRYPMPVNGFALLYFNPKIIGDILSYAGVDMMADSYTQQLGFTTADIYNAFSGNMAFIYTGTNQPPTADAAQKTYLVNLEIGDRTAFNKVFTGLVNKNILTKSGSYYRLGMFGGANFIIEPNGNNLFFASNEAVISSYLSAASSANNLPADVKKDINGKSAVLYVDVNTLLKHYVAASSDTSAIDANAINLFKNIIATTDKSNDKTVKGNIDLNLLDDKENSLAAIVKFLAAAKKSKMQDNTIIPPTLDEEGSDSVYRKNNPQ